MIFIRFCAIAGLLASAVLSAESAPETDSVEVALAQTDGRTAIDVVLNGAHALRANYDSGAQGMVIAQSLADELDLPVVGEALLGSPAGGVPVPVKIVQLQSLSVGGVAMNTAPRSLDALLMEDSRLPSGVRLILSSSNFPGSLIELDFVAARFRVSPSPVGDEADWLALDERGLTATTLVIGSTRIPLHVDTGNPGSLDLPRSFAAELPLDAPLQEHAKITLVDKTLGTYRAPMKTEARIGEQAVSLDGTFVFADFPFANLGVDGLRKARLQIDHSKRRWRLRFASSPTRIEGRLAR
jgi:hypothetical protein